jgi:hypothetical protein
MYAGQFPVIMWQQRSSVFQPMMTFCQCWIALWKKALSLLMAMTKIRCVVHSSLVATCSIYRFSWINGKLRSKLQHTLSQTCTWYHDQLSHVNHFCHAHFPFSCMYVGFLFDHRNSAMILTFIYEKCVFIMLSSGNVVGRVWSFLSVSTHHFWMMELSMVYCYVIEMDFYWDTAPVIFYWFTNVVWYSFIKFWWI